MYNQIRNITYNYWVIPEAYKQYFASLYILKWKVSYLTTKAKHGVIKHNGVDYYVVYKSLFGIRNLRPKDKVWLSFREPKNSLHPVVLISPER